MDKQKLKRVKSILKKAQGESVDYQEEIELINKKLKENKND